MSRDQEQAGRDWVIQTIKELANENGISIENPEWESEAGNERFYLTFDVVGKRERMHFDRDTLEDLPSSETLQSNIKRKLSKIIRPTKRR